MLDAGFLDSFDYTDGEAAGDPKKKTRDVEQRSAVSGRCTAWPRCRRL
jgi:hypothetical protein